MTLPDRLSAALSSHRPRSGDLEHRPTGRKIIQRGDIRQVAPCSDPNDAMRLALVLDEDHERSSVEIMLVHPYVELATETDLVFAPDETGAPYPVVIETRVRSAVCTYQVRRSSKLVGERVGGLSAETLEEIGKVAAADDPFSVSPRTGSPLAGPADSRWNFKKQEVKVLNQLAADRISAVFNGGFNPQLLSLVSQNAEAPSEADELIARSSEWTLEDLDVFQDVGVFDPDTWIEQFGRDLYISYTQQIDDCLAQIA